MRNLSLLILSVCMKVKILALMLLPGFNDLGDRCIMYKHYTGNQNNIHINSISYYRSNSENNFHLNINLVLKNEPYSQKTYLRTCAPSEDSDQPAHSRSLIRIFTERFLDIKRCQVSLCGQRELWSDWADAHADLSLRWAHMTEGTFSQIPSHMIRGRQCPNRACVF